MLRALVVVFGTLLVGGVADAKPDFQNFTYQPACLGGASVRMKKGGAKKGGMSLAVGDVVEGDLDGDGKPETTVMLSCDADEGTGRFTEAYVYRVTGNKATLAAAVATGDRAHGGIEAIAVEDGLLAVHRNSTSDGACCTEWLWAQWFKLAKKSLVEAKLGERRAVDSLDILPISAVKFAKGASSATIAGTTTVGDEHVLGARAKQTLTAKLTVKKGKARLVVFDSDGAYPLTLSAKSETEFSTTREANGTWHVLVVPPEGADPAEIQYSLSVGIQ